MPPSLQAVELLGQILTLSFIDRRWVRASLEEPDIDRKRQLHRVRQARYRASHGDAPVTLGDAHGDAKVSPGPLSKPHTPRDQEACSEVQEKPGKTKTAREGEQAVMPLDVSRRDAVGDAPVTLGDALVTPTNGHRRGCVPGTTLSWALWEEIEATLRSAPDLWKDPKVRSPKFWDAQLSAAPDVDEQDEIRKAQAWITANRERAPRKSIARFLHNWVRRAQEHAGRG